MYQIFLKLTHNIDICLRSYELCKQFTNPNLLNMMGKYTKESQLGGKNPSGRKNPQTLSCLFASEFHPKCEGNMDYGLLTY